MRSFARLAAVLFSGTTACLSRPEPTFLDASGQPQKYRSMPSESPLETASYELAPVHPGFGAQRMYYVPERREWIVFAERFAYRYDRSGDAIEMVADDYRFGHYANRSGVSFKLDGYCDWILTGDPVSKPYRFIEDSQIADDELEAAIRGADDYQELYDVDHQQLPGRAVALKVGANWLMFHQQRLAAFWEEQHTPPLRGMRAAPDRVLELEPDARWNVNHKASPLQITAFRKTGSSPLISFHDTGFSGDYGVGYYKLSHRGEDFHFQARTRRGGDYMQEVNVFAAPDASQDEALFVGMGAGLYVLRHKVRAQAPDAERMFKQQYPLALGFEGVAAGKGSWRAIAYVDGSSDSLTQDLSTPVASALRRVPNSVTFHWPSERNVPFLLDDTMLVRTNAEQLVELAFDRVEILSLFQRIPPQSERSLHVQIESFAMADRAHVFLEAAGQRVELETVKFVDSSQPGKRVLVDTPVDQTTSRELQRAKLAKLTVEAVHTPEAFRAFLEFATPLDSIPWERATSRNLDCMRYLINQLVRAGRDDEAKQAFELFTTRLVPYLDDEHFARVQFIASDMLAVASRSHDAALFEHIWQRALGGEAKAAQLTDARLVYNIACMHARLGDKDDVLRWTRRALAMGKSPDQFRKDADFSASLHDAAFVQLLAEHADVPMSREPP